APGRGTTGQAGTASGPAAAPAPEASGAAAPAGNSPANMAAIAEALAALAASRDGAALGAVGDRARVAAEAPKTVPAATAESVAAGLAAKQTLDRIARAAITALEARTDGSGGTSDVRVLASRVAASGPLPANAPARPVALAVAVPRADTAS